MKKKFTWLLFATLLMAFSSLSAQNLSKKAKEKIDQEVSEMARVMDLDDTQKAKVLELKTQQILARKLLRDNVEKGTDQFKEAKSKINQEFRGGFKEVCTRDQLKKWRKHQKAKK
ncbi:hypothetical protein [Marinilabilia rubra]|nr:hypothetical protein [Marinilabilia rubra]